MDRINFYLSKLTGYKFALELGPDSIEVICLRHPRINIPEGGIPIKGTKVKIKGDLDGLESEKPNQTGRGA